jgi:hypothetical protein
MQYLTVKAAEILAEIRTQHLLNRSLELFHDNILLNKSSSICINLLILSLFLLFKHLFGSVHFFAPCCCTQPKPPPSFSYIYHYSVCIACCRVTSPGAGARKKIQTTATTATTASREGCQVAPAR